MSQINAKVIQTPIYTAQGGPAKNISAEQTLRRTVMCAMLWEDSFYESGLSVADRVKDLAPKCRPEFVAACAYEARTKMKLRHMPLLLVREMARLDTHKHLVKDLLRDVIQRADELTEFMAIYWKDGKTPISAQVKKGLAAAMRKFSAFELAKYNRDKVIKLRDVLFLVHSKPSDAPGDKFTKLERKAGADRKLTDGEQVYLDLVNGTLATPDTWEVALSAGDDKKETFERLMSEKKLGALAFLRNLRNISESGVDVKLVQEYVNNLKTDRVLPFRFIAAARAVPQWEPVIEEAMMKCLEGQETIPGRTVLLVDVSGSMDAPISGKSDMKRLDAAYGLGILLREVCEEIGIFTFSDGVVSVPPRSGFALRDAMHSSQRHASTYLGNAVTSLNASIKYDRLIVITDEQSEDRVPDPLKDAKGYVINVASNKNGVGYGKWMHIDGWSESVIDFIREFESE
jgi:60 kDa SS-A/Ro ribonucleoprotein